MTRTETATDHELEFRCQVHKELGAAVEKSEALLQTVPDPP